MIRSGRDATGANIMHTATRITLTVPFIILFFQYMNFTDLLFADASIPPFWKNHGLREAIFAATLCFVILNLIWSTKVTAFKLRMIGMLGLPLVFAFWIGDMLVGFDPLGNFQTQSLAHAVAAILFVVGYFMAVSTGKPKKK